MSFASRLQWYILIFKVTVIIIVVNNNRDIFFDVPEYWQTYFHDPASISMEGILVFNKHLTFLLIVIVLFVGWFLFSTIYYFVEFNNKYNSKFTHSKELEIVWTSVPALILLFGVGMHRVIFFTPATIAGTAFIITELG